MNRRCNQIVQHDRNVECVRFEDSDLKSYVVFDPFRANDVHKRSVVQDAFDIYLRVDDWCPCAVPDEPNGQQSVKMRVSNCAF